MPHGAPLPSLENVCGDFVGTRTFITETYGGTPIHDDWTEGQRPILHIPRPRKRTRLLVFSAALTRLFTSAASSLIIFLFRYLGPRKDTCWRSCRGCDRRPTPSQRDCADPFPAGSIWCHGRSDKSPEDSAGAPSTTSADYANSGDAISEPISKQAAANARSLRLVAAARNLP